MDKENESRIGAEFLCRWATVRSPQICKLNFPAAGLSPTPTAIHKNLPPGAHRVSLDPDGTLTYFLTEPNGWLTKVTEYPDGRVKKEYPESGMMTPGRAGDIIDPVEFVAGFGPQPGAVLGAGLAPIGTASAPGARVTLSGGVHAREL